MFLKLDLSASSKYYYGSTAIKVILILSNRLQTSESDVYRCQIMTSKDSPRAERVNPILIYCELWIALQ